VLYLPWSDTILGFAFQDRIDCVARWTQASLDWRWQRHEPLLAGTDLRDFRVVADTARRRVVHFATIGHLGRICEWDGESQDPLTSARLTSVDPEAPGGDLLEGYAMVYDAARGDVLLFGGEGEHGVSGRLLRFWSDVPRFSTFGRGCSGAVGEPRLTMLAGPPIAGQVFALQLSAVPPRERAPLLHLGFSRTDWLGLPLPFDLGIVGMTGCRVLASVDHVATMQVLGEYATWGMFLPNLPGVTFHAQAMVFDQGANAAGMVMSDAAEITIGRR